MSDLGVVLAIISPTIPEQTTDTDKLISSQQPINTSVEIDYNCAIYNSKYEQYVYGSTACHAILAKKTLIFLLLIPILMNLLKKGQ
ncbi:uncharacterized protein LOC120337561 isoform X3 [Styela clava]